MVLKNGNSTNRFRIYPHGAVSGHITSRKKLQRAVPYAVASSI